MCAESLVAGARAKLHVFVLFYNGWQGTFAACHDLDPAFARGLEAAAEAGVEVLVYGCDVSSEAVRIARPLYWRR
jgi:DNA-binding sugar fermentation-stimulating protein